MCSLFFLHFNTELYISLRILKESRRVILIVRGVVVVYNVFLSPHEISEPLKIWNFVNIKKSFVSSEDVQQKNEDVQQKKKNLQKIFFSPRKPFLCVLYASISCSAENRYGLTAHKVALSRLRPASYLKLFVLTHRDSIVIMQRLIFSFHFLFNFHFDWRVLDWVYTQI